MASKVLTMPTPAEDASGASRGYQAAMDGVRRGISENIWDQGSREERLAFAENCFAARVEGAKLHAKTGTPQYVPDMREENGSLRWGLTMTRRESVRVLEQPVSSKGSRYEEAARRLGVFEETGAESPEQSADFV